MCDKSATEVFLSIQPPDFRKHTKTDRARAAS